MSLIRRAGQTIYNGAHVGSRGTLDEIKHLGGDDFSHTEEEQQYLSIVKNACWGNCSEEEDLEILERIQYIYGVYNTKGGEFNEKYFTPGY